MVRIFASITNYLVIRLKTEIIGMDAWHKSNIYKYPVLVMSYVTESLHGGVLGIAICDQATHEHYNAFIKTLFNHIRSHGGPSMQDWTPIIMIDNDDAEIKACEEEGNIINAFIKFY